MGRATQGVKLIDLRGKDTIAAVAKVEKDDSEDDSVQLSEEDVENLNETEGEKVLQLMRIRSSEDSVLERKLQKNKLSNSLNINPSFFNWFEGFFLKIVTMAKILVNAL